MEQSAEIDPQVLNQQRANQAVMMRRSKMLAKAIGNTLLEIESVNDVPTRDEAKIIILQKELQEQLADLKDTGLSAEIYELAEHMETGAKRITHDRNVLPTLIQSLQQRRVEIEAKNLEVEAQFKAVEAKTRQELQAPKSETLASVYQKINTKRINQEAKKTFNANKIKDAERRLEIANKKLEDCKNEFAAFELSLSLIDVNSLTDAEKRNLNWDKNKKQKELNALVAAQKAAENTLQVKTDTVQKEQAAKEAEIKAECQKFETMVAADPVKARAFLESRVSKDIEQVLEDKITKALPSQSNEGANLRVMKDKLSKAKQQLVKFATDKIKKEIEEHGLTGDAPSFYDRIHNLVNETRTDLEVGNVNIPDAPVAPVVEIAPELVPVPPPLPPAPRRLIVPSEPIDAAALMNAAANLRAIQHEIIDLNKLEYLLLNGFQAFNILEDTVWSGLMVGAGQLEKYAPYHLKVNLDHGSMYQGPITIYEGKLSINGDLSDAEILVEDETIFGGNPIIRSLVNNGMVAPGNSIGIVQVKTTFINNKDLEIEINSQGQSDEIRVNGLTTLNGGALLIVPMEGGDYVPTTYTFLTSGGGIIQNVPGGFDVIKIAYGIDVLPAVRINGSRIQIILDAAAADAINRVIGSYVPRYAANNVYVQLQGMIQKKSLAYERLSELRQQESQDKELWVKVYQGKNEQKQVGDKGYKAQRKGFMVGRTLINSESTHVGAAMGLEQIRTTYFKGNQAKSDTDQLNLLLYYNHSFERIYLQGSAGWVYSHNSFDREVWAKDKKVPVRASNNSHGGFLTGRIGVSSYKTNTYEVKPYIEASCYALQEESYTEKLSKTKITINKRENFIMEGAIGVQGLMKITKRFSMRWDLGVSQQEFVKYKPVTYAFENKLDKKRTVKGQKYKFGLELYMSANFSYAIKDSIDATAGISFRKTHNKSDQALNLGVSICF